jgi:cyclomaltodextrinase / maltogenic alpha-amylase / neopullulanase
MPREWVEHAIWWQVYPIGFVGAERELAKFDGSQPVAHRLGRLHAWLDYTIELGASGLALGPVFASHTHGYDTIDYYRIDPRLGDDADFDALLKAAQERGLRVLLDGVFNHVGRGFFAFAEVLEHGPGAAHASWFTLTWPQDWRPGIEPSSTSFEGHDQLIALNHDEPEVADYVVAVMQHWLERGADGWRLDAAYAVPPAFWSSVVPRVRATHPDAYLVGEVLHGDYAEFVTESGLDSLTQYELWKAIWSSIKDANFFELAWALERHNALLDTFVPLTFVGNHDVTRLASQIDDDRHLPHALVVLFAVAGTPSIYEGDEQAFRGIKEERAGGDDAIRPAFPDTPAGLAPDGWPTYRLHQDLIGLRRRHSWLHTARTRQVHLSNQELTFESVCDDHRLLIVLNLADTPSEQPAPGALSVELGSADLLQPGTDDARVVLAAHGWAILTTT